jgi:hypothetical protein
VNHFFFAKYILDLELEKLVTQRHPPKKKKNLGQNWLCLVRGWEWGKRQPPKTKSCQKIIAVFQSYIMNLHLCLLPAKALVLRVLPMWSWNEGPSSWACRHRRRESREPGLHFALHHYPALSRYRCSSCWDSNGWGPVEGPIGKQPPLLCCQWKPHGKWQCTPPS